MFSEWLYLPEAAAAFLCDPGVWLFLIGGVFLGFVVGVVPGLGPTMGMALCLGLVFHLEYTHGMALLVGIFVASCGSGGITASLINIPAFINLDFADVRSIMKDAGFAHMGVGVAKGAGKAENAAKAAISSPLLETSIAGARGVIINITSSPDIGLEDVETAASMITQSAHPDANIIWGTAFDERLSDEMSITVVATGFESTPEVDEPIQAHVDAKRAAQQTAVQQPAQPVQPVQPAAPVQPAQQPINPPMPNPIFTQSFSTGMDTPVAAQPAAPAEEEDDGDYFDDLLSILNKRS